MSIPSSKRGGILDPVNPGLFQSLELIYCCEQCSHFDRDKGSCTLGHDARNFLQATQLKRYELSGRMNICRDQEID